MADKQLLVGSIDLSLLKGAHIARGSDGKESVVIPVADNPTIFLGAADKGGHIYMDIEVRESPENQYGNTHFVKLSVGKKKREEMRLSADDLKKYTPIVGNLRTLAKKQDGGDDLPE